MASVDKLLKAFEALKVFQPDLAQEPNRKKDLSVSKKDKITNCNIITDCICSPNLRNNADFQKFLALVVETFLDLCDDAESDVRMVADECLNRTIKTLLETNLGKLQVELYKEIKKNGSQRSLRGALWRFADMCHLIRPQKCRLYAVNLLPCLARICSREEEAVQDTLSQAMLKLCPVIMSFTNDNEIKVLLKAFLPNLRSGSAPARRTAASSLTLVCLHSCKPSYFVCYLLTTLLDMVVPLQDDLEANTLLGVLLALRHLIPHLSIAEKLNGTFLPGLWSVEKANRSPTYKIEEKQQVQVLELLLHYLGHLDHNVVTAALEALVQLLRTPPDTLHKLLLKPGAITKSTILGINSSPRPNSQVRMPSMADDLALLDDPQLEQAQSKASEKAAARVSVTLPSVFTDTEHAKNTDRTVDDFVEVAAERPDTLAVKVPAFEGLEETDRKGKGSKTGFELTSGDVDDYELTQSVEKSYSSINIGDIAAEEDKGIITPADSVSSCTSPVPHVQQEERTSLRKGVSEECLISPDDVISMDMDFEESMDLQELGSYRFQEDIGAAVTTPIRVGEVGELIGEDMPLLYCVRLVSSKFLLTGFPRELLNDKQCRVSMKTLAMGCVSASSSLCPKVLCQSLHVKCPTSGMLPTIVEMYGRCAVGKICEVFNVSARSHAAGAGES